MPRYPIPPLLQCITNILILTLLDRSPTVEWSANRSCPRQELPLELTNTPDNKILDPDPVKFDGAPQCVSVFTLGTQQETLCQEVTLIVICSYKDFSITLHLLYSISIPLFLCPLSVGHLISTLTNGFLSVFIIESSLTYITMPEEGHTI